MKHIKYLVLFITLLANSLFAYSNSIVVGITPFSPPFSAVDSSNHYFGFCIDLMNEVCKRINESCVFKGVGVEKQMSELDSGTIDVTFPPTPISVTETDNYIFSMPYITSNGQFATLDSNIKSMDDLKNKKLGVMQESHLENILQNYTTQDNIKEFTKIPTLISAMTSHDIDAVLLNINIVKYLINNKIIPLQPVGQPISLGNGYGVVALKKNANLIGEINKALLQIQNDGTYTALYNKYFGY